MNIHKINTVSQDFGLFQNQSIVAQLEVFFSSDYGWVIALLFLQSTIKPRKIERLCFEILANSNETGIQWIQRNRTIHDLLTVYNIKHKFWVYKRKVFLIQNSYQLVPSADKLLQTTWTQIRPDKT